jgi:hypothetical protein
VTPARDVFHDAVKHGLIANGWKITHDPLPVSFELGDMYNVLAMLDEVTTLEDVRNLASDEDVQKWQSAIANHLINVKDEISLVKLQRVLQMPMVEVWLGLLLGGFTLEQHQFGRCTTALPRRNTLLCLQSSSIKSGEKFI